jgi:hypothetical protein
MSNTVDYVSGSRTSSSGTVGIAVISTASGDVQKIVLTDATGASALTPAQEGTDSTDANAVQATAGVGLRGWLSTLVSLLRAGTAKVLIREAAQTAWNTGQVTVTATATRVRTAQTGRTVVTVRNISGSSGPDVWVGPTNGVTSTTGYLLRAAGFDAQDVKWTGEVWAITASGSATVTYAEEIQ